MGEALCNSIVLDIYFHVNLCNIMILLKITVSLELV